MTQTTEAPSAANTTSDFPGKTLGIVGLVLAFIVSLAGIVVSAIALRESRAAGYKNPIAEAGLIVSVILTVLGVVGAIISIVVTVALWQSCGYMGNGVHMMQNGASLDCNFWR